MDDAPVHSRSGRTARIALAALAVAALGAGLYGYSMQMGRDAAAERLRRLEEQVTRAGQQRQDAIEQRAAAERQRLIAERQRQDAVEQRAAAERQRLNAEQQRQAAVEQRSLAERERLNAEKQRQAAIEQRSLAERERLNAEEQRQAAIAQRTVAEGLRLLAVGRSLAAEAVKLQQKGGDERLAGLLAVQAFLFTVRNGGSERAPDVYNALRQSLFALEPGGRSLGGHQDEVRAIAFAADGSTLFSASDDGSLRRWALGAAGGGRIVARSRGRMQALALRNGRLAAGDSEGTVWLWDGRGEAAPRIWQGASVSALALGPLGRRLAVGGLDGSVRLWSLVDDTRSDPLPAGDPMEAHPLTFHGETLLRGDEGGVLPVPLGEGAWPGPTGRVSALASGPGGLLAAATEGGDITVWRAGGARPQTVIGHASVITSLAFDAEGGMLASGSLDNTVKIWNLRAPEDEPVSVDHGAWVWDVAFGPQGNLLASAGADRTVRLWPTDARRMAGQLCDRLEGGLAPDEWFRHVGSDIPYEETCASSTLQTLDASHEGASHAFSEH